MREKRKYDSTVARIAGKDRKSTRLNSSHSQISYAVFCLKKKNPTGTPFAPPGRRARQPPSPGSGVTPTCQATDEHCGVLPRGLPRSRRGHVAHVARSAGG